MNEPLHATIGERLGVVLPMPAHTLEQRVGVLEERMDGFARRLREAEQTMSNLSLQITMQGEERNEQHSEIRGRFELLDAKLDARFRALDGLAVALTSFMQHVEADEQRAARGRG